MSRAKVLGSNSYVIVQPDGCWLAEREGLLAATAALRRINETRARIGADGPAILMPRARALALAASPPPAAEPAP